MHKYIKPLLAALAVLAAGILVHQVFFSGKSRADTDPQVMATVERLTAMEAVDTASLVLTEPEQTKEAAPAESTDTTASPRLTEAEAQQKVLSGDLLDGVTMRQVFAGTVILGDSVTESIWEYDYLDTDIVISKRGLAIAGADDQIATAIASHPSAIFMAFGANDLEWYGSDASAFIAPYKVQVNKLLEALPGVPIYINCIPPISSTAIAAYPDLQYYPQYNEALKEMCSELGLTFVDCSFILEADPGLYEPDGEHLVASYYPQWITYMAEMAGLTS